MAGWVVLWLAGVVVATLGLTLLLFRLIDSLWVATLLTALAARAAAGLVRRAHDGALASHDTCAE